jgi:hypothetical protein
MEKPPLLRLLDDSLSPVVPGHAIIIAGQWSTAWRRTYASETQLGTGNGPFVNVVDARWIGTLSSSVDLAILLLFLTPTHLHWVKASTLASALPVRVSVTAYTDCSPTPATFTASIADAHSLGVPIVANAGISNACSVALDESTTGRTAILATADQAKCHFLALPRSLVKVGRNHLWRLRDDITGPLPPSVQELLVRRRAGSLKLEPV